MYAPFRNCIVNPQKNPKLYEPHKLPNRRRDCDAAKNFLLPSGEFFGLRIYAAILGADIISLDFFWYFFGSSQKSTYGKHLYDNQSLPGGNLY